MRRLAVGMIGLACAALPLPAVAQNAAVEAPIKAFVAAFDKGDMAGAAATHSLNGLSIIDEVPPYHWWGAGAFQAWAAALAKDSAAKGITDQSVTISDPSRELVTGMDAYVIVPAVYHFKQKGVAMAETAQFTFALHSANNRWKIVSWTWTGPDASPAK